MHISDRVDVVSKRVANVIAYNQNVEDIDLIIGDRYLVEVLDIENEKHVEGTDKSIMLMDGPLSLAYEVGRVLKVVNGDRLETDVTKKMYWTVGDVIVMERLAGRDQIMLGGRPYRLINQSHTFFRFDGAVVRKAEAAVAAAANQQA